MEDYGPFEVSVSGQPRRYHITSLLGRGGFGGVYRARMDGSDGFVKDVAIKILSDPNPPEEVLARFRDEARILGLTRHPNVVQIDQPIRLNGRWAVVMDYVDGTSVDELIRGTVLPPQIALEIVAQVAEVLHDLWVAPGPNGEPLHLIHRDIKPSNVQITPTGHVKLLDFGVARADFDNREALTSLNLGGTPGYIAPERTQGIESPAGDVFSLGVMLRRLVARPKSSSSIPIQHARDVQHVLDLSTRMRDPDPDRRPAPAEVARECRQMRAEMAPLDLREWAPMNVPSAPQRPPDEYVGRTLSETLAPGLSRLRPVPAQQAQENRGPVLLAGIVAMGSFAVVVFAGVILVALAIWMYLRAPQVADNREVPSVVPGTVTDPVEPPAPPAPDPAVDAGSATPDPQAPTPTPTPAPTPVERPRPRVVRPTPAPVAAPAMGELVVTGEATAVEVTCGGRPFPPGQVPAGRCELRATFPGQAAVPAGSVDVAAGGRVVVQCLAAFQRCRIR